MTKSDFQLYRRWYEYLDRLDSKRFVLKNNFVQGDVSFLGRRKVMCNSRACAVGYLPAIFTSWTWVEEGIPLLKESSSGLSFKDTADFFGLSEEQVQQIAVGKNYNSSPTLNACLRRMYSIAKSYGYSLNEK